MVLPTGCGPSVPLTKRSATQPWESRCIAIRTVADVGTALLRHDGGLAPLRKNVEDGDAHADRGERRRDLIGGLYRMPGDETKRARCHLDRDVAAGALVVEDGTIQHH